MSVDVAMSDPNVSERNGERYRRLVEEWIPGGDAWSREARIVFRLAAEAGIHLDEERLSYGDVHDLQALERCLWQAMAHVRHGMREQHRQRRLLAEYSRGKLPAAAEGR